MTGKTLKELNVHVGDVVVMCGDESDMMTVVDCPPRSKYFSDHWVLRGSISGDGVYRDHDWRIISRAKKYTAWQFTPAPENAETHTMPDGSIAWRVVVEPVVKTVTKYMWADNGGWTDIQYCKNPSYRLTYNTIDGVPYCASVKVECM